MVSVLAAVGVLAVAELGQWCSPSTTALEIVNGQLTAQFLVASGSFVVIDSLFDSRYSLVLLARPELDSIAS